MFSCRDYCEVDQKTNKKGWTTCRGRKIAKVAMARKLAVHLYWMWRYGCDYGQMQKLGSHYETPRFYAAM
jgi:hypothetical protein